MPKLAKVNERDGLVGEAVQGGDGFFVSAAEGGDGGNIPDEEGVDEMVFAGGGDGFVGFGHGGVAIAGAGFNGGEGGGDVAVVAKF